MGSPAWEPLSVQGIPCRRGQGLGDQPNTTHLSPCVRKAVRTGIGGADVLTSKCLWMSTGQGTTASSIAMQTGRGVNHSLFREDMRPVAKYINSCLREAGSEPSPLYTKGTTNGLSLLQ